MELLDRSKFADKNLENLVQINPIKDYKTKYDGIEYLLGKS